MFSLMALACGRTNPVTVLQLGELCWQLDFLTLGLVALMAYWVPAISRVCVKRPIVLSCLRWVLCFTMLLRGASE